MTKIILLALLISTTALFAQANESLEKTEAAPVAPEQAPPVGTPALIMEDSSNFKKFEPKKSHWLSSLGAETMKYDVPYSFKGNRSNFSPRPQELWGGRLGLGGALHLGFGIVTTTKIEGYYMGTLFSQILNGGPDSEDVDFAYTKRSAQIFGFDAAQQLGFQFGMKTKNPILGDWTYLTVEPFVEAGIGKAKAYNRINYSYDTGSTPSSARERYKDTVNDDLTNARVGGGVNFTSSSGFFLYLRATFNRYEIVKRERRIYSQPNGQAPTVSLDNQRPRLDQVTVYALGGGYKF
jgi:hypothetical protein